MLNTISRNAAVSRPQPSAPELITLHAAAEPTRKRRGEAAEAAFLARATHLGFTVCLPWGDSNRYDSVVELGRGFLRVQVKSATGYAEHRYRVKTTVPAATSTPPPKSISSSPTSFPKISGTSSPSSPSDAAKASASIPPPAAPPAPSSKNTAKPGASSIPALASASAKATPAAAAAKPWTPAAPSAPCAAEGHSSQTRMQTTAMLTRQAMPMWLGHSCPRPLTFAVVLDFDLLLASMPNQTLDRKYDYHRNLPHYQKAGLTIFITFCKGNRTLFSPESRDAILHHCLHDNGKRYDLHAAVVMPDHVHLLLTPLPDDKGWPYALPLILKLLKGTSARSVNKLEASSGPLWQEESFDHVLRSQESLEEKREYIRQNPVRRGLVKRPEDYKWLWLEPPAGN